MRYKEGDTVRIKSLEWFNQNKKDNTFAITQGYRVEHPDYSYVFITPMAEYCGKEAIISTCDETLGIYKLKIDNIDNIYNWCDFMLEDINVNDMKEKTITVTLEKAQKWYAGRNKALKELALQAFTEEELKDTLPNTWEEFCENNPTKLGECVITIRSVIADSIRPAGTPRHPVQNRFLIGSKEKASSLIALVQLEHLRDCYRNGWTPNWTDGSIKYTIFKVEDGLATGDIESLGNRFLTFQSKELRNKFIKNFGNLIELAGDRI